MGIVFRQSVKTSIVTFTGAFLGAVVIWLSANYIPKQELGYLNFLTDQSVLLVSFLGLGSGNVLMVYVHRYNTSDSRRKLLLTLCMAIPLITIVLVSICYFLSREWLLRHFQTADAQLVKQYFVWMPIYTLLFVSMNTLELYLGTQMKVAISAFMREVIVRVLNVILIGLFVARYIGFPGLVIGTVAIYIVPVVTFIVLSVRTEGFGLSFKLSDFSRAEYKDMIQFSWFHFLLAISITLMSKLDALALPFYDHNGLSSVAIYRIPVFVISFLLIPYKAMYTATFAVLTQAFTNNDIPKARDIFMRSSLNIFIATVGVGILIFCNMENALAVIKNGGYNDIIPVFGILLIGRLVDLSTGMNDAVLTITNYYKFNVYVSAVLIVILYLLLRWLVPLYGIYGAAWSTTITLIIFNIAKYVFVWQKIEMQPYSKNTILIIVSGIPALAAGCLLPHFFSGERHTYIHALADTAIRSTLIGLIYVIMLLWLKPSKDLEEYISSIRKHKRLF